jgi:NAD(P)-dependent dehydrogenase (short-subunit alcohol dehydrogenase family)
MRFTGKSVVILGGNSGIGLASAIEFAQEGARVVITGRNETTLAAAAAQIGTGTIAVRADTSNLHDLDRLFAQVKEKIGGIDVLFVNSGIGGTVPLMQMTPAIWDEMQNVNLRGPFFAIQKAVPLMSRGGSIVLTSSIGHLKGLPGNSHYAAAKAGLRSLARNLGAELVDSGIRVNCVSPGPIDTPLLARSNMEHMREFIRELNPMKRWAHPRETARTVLFLASDDASFITGADLLVDGGMCNF